MPNTLLDFKNRLDSQIDIQIKGDPACVIDGVCTIQEGKTGHITFLTNPAYKKYLATSKASAIILTLEDAKMCETNALITSNPYYVYSIIAAFFEVKTKLPPGIHPSTQIGKDCCIDPSAIIGPQCVIGNHVRIGARTQVSPGCIIGDFTEIGEDSELDARVTLYHQIRVGNRVRIASGVVVGSDGFGIAKHKNTWHKVPQLGTVVIEDDVDIGANTTIDRGAIEDTVIGKGVKLDNLIQVGHNVQVGENTAIAGCVGISGSARIGKNCVIGGAACFAGHITVADNVMITGLTAVTKSIIEPGVYSSGAGGLMKNTEWRKNTIRVRQLEKIVERVKELEDCIAKDKLIPEES